MDWTSALQPCCIGTVPAVYNACRQHDIYHDSASPAWHQHAIHGSCSIFSKNVSVINQGNSILIICDLFLIGRMHLVPVSIL